MRTSLFAALLIAACPVFGSLAFSVRPDTMGLAFQTIGFGLVLRSSSFSRAAIGTPSAIAPILAGVGFGLAACTKQHLIVAGVVLIEVGH